MGKTDLKCVFGSKATAVRKKVRAERLATYIPYYNRGQNFTFGSVNDEDDL